MRRFQNWLSERSQGRPMFISDNNGFDWQFINWYFHHFTGANPFGFSSTNLGSLYKGIVRDTAQTSNTSAKHATLIIPWTTPKEMRKPSLLSEMSSS